MAQNNQQNQNRFNPQHNRQQQQAPAQPQEQAADIQDETAKTEATSAKIAKIVTEIEDSEYDPEHDMTIVMLKLVGEIALGVRNTASARAELHAWFNNLPQDEKMYLYENNRAHQTAARFKAYSEAMQQEVPAILSSLRIG